MLFKPTQLSVWWGILCVCVYVCGVSCNLGITLHPCMGSIRQPNFHSLHQTLYQSLLFFFLSAKQQPLPFFSPGPRMSFTTTQLWYLSYLKAHFSSANCYLWTFVCSRASLLTIPLIAIICYSALVLILGMGAVK